MLGDLLHRYRSTVLMTVYAFVALLLMVLHVSPYVTGFKTAVWFLISPEVVTSGQFFNKIDALTARVFRLIRVEGENYILRQQNAELSKKELERDALEEENNRLRELLDLHEKNFPKAVAAEVIGHDVREFFQAIVINKGLEDGVNPAAAVVAILAGHVRLVGRVLEVSRNTAKIMLLTDAVSSVAITVRRTADTGLLEGRNKPWLLATYLPRSSKIQAGDEVMSAGLGGVFPPGLPIGTVEYVKDTADGFFKEAKVIPYTDEGAVREVLVLERVQRVENKSS